MKTAERAGGKVFVVGAGPGAPDLITLRGLRALRRADVVFYDALVNRDLLSETAESTEKVFVGKRCGRHAMDQREINQRIVCAAREGRTVVRLKGGDPLIFGRGGEEALACAEAGIAFELIPGVTSALGAASYAGIPLTHRGVAASVGFVTARDGGTSQKHGRTLAELAASVDTLVIFMGGSCLQSIADSLVEGGIPRTVSVAVISQATLETQKTIVGTLDSINNHVAAAGLATPILIIVGEVANLSSALNWFECRQAAAVPEESVAF